MGYKKVEGDKLDLSTRKYQNNAFDNINEILFNNNSSYNRYAALIFPTGGGKSYMACGVAQYMTQLKSKDENHKRQKIEEIGIVKLLKHLMNV